MNKRLVAKILVLSLMLTLLLPGCAKKKETTVSLSSITESTTTEEPSTTTTEKAPTSVPTTDATTESTPESSEEPTETDEPSDTSESETTQEPSETTAPPPETTTQPSETVPPPPPPTFADPGDDPDYLSQLQQRRETIIANAAYYDSLDNDCKDSWCYKRMTDHSPSGSYEYFTIADYNGVYRNKNVAEGDKVIYLTFDCGYASSRTSAILDVLAQHNVKASFFVTKNYLQGCMDLAIRMKQEGHMVCNHTVSHSNLVNMSVEEICAEIFDVAEYFYTNSGYKLDPYFRPPAGTYTVRMMSIIRDAGYKTVFWSMAYQDYDQKHPPEPGYVTDQFVKYHHNGAIVLMHNDCQANVDELDAVLTYLESEGYRFGLLNELG